MLYVRVHRTAMLRTYDIRISGRLAVLADEFAPHAVTFAAGVSVIRARDIDQAALFGIVAQLQALRLELLEIDSSTTPSAALPGRAPAAEPPHDADRPRHREHVGGGPVDRAELLLVWPSAHDRSTPDGLGSPAAGEVRPPAGSPRSLHAAPARGSHHRRPDLVHGDRVRSARGARRALARHAALDLRGRGAGARARSGRRSLVRRGWKRGRAAVAVFAGLFVGAGLLVLVAAGPVWEQIVEFVQKLPAYWDQTPADRLVQEAHQRRRERTTRSARR